MVRKWPSSATDIAWAHRVELENLIVVAIVANLVSSVRRSNGVEPLLVVRFSRMTFPVALILCPFSHNEIVGSNKRIASGFSDSRGISQNVPYPPAWAVMSLFRSPGT